MSASRLNCVAQEVTEKHNKLIKLRAETEQLNTLRKELLKEIGKQERKMTAQIRALERDISRQIRNTINEYDTRRMNFRRHGNNINRR